MPNTATVRFLRPGRGPRAWSNDRCAARMSRMSDSIATGAVPVAEHDPASEQRPPWLWPRAAYVHVPFCAHHCGYCDFAVAVGQDHQIELYLDALAAELATLGSPQPVRTLFLGGGTPTHLNPAQLERLLAAVRRWLPPGEGHEFSVEANPDTLDAE